MRVLLGLLVIAAATFVAAYYVPLLRAHQALTRLSEESGAQVQALSAKVQKVEQDLAAASRERDRLADAERARQASSRDGAARVDSLVAALDAALKPHTSKSRVVVASGGEAARILVRVETLIPAGKTDLSPAGGALLCDVASAAGAHRLEVTVNAIAAAAPTESTWEAPSTEAGKIAAHLEQKCGRKGLASVSVRAVDDSAPRDVEFRVWP